MSLRLRPYQREAIDAAYEYFRSGDGSPLIDLPTGAGKSLVLAGFCHDLVTKWPGMRLVVLSHSIELVEQDYMKLKEYWTKAPCGMFSASLGKKQAHHPITFGTVQSLYRKAEVLGHRDVILIDEAHLVSRKVTGMYNRLITTLKRINPRIRMLGLSATIYRLDSGLLYEGDDALFDDVCYEAKLADLIYQGYLTPIVSKLPETQADVRRIKITAGEFNSASMEGEFIKITEEAIADAIPRLESRKAVMWFCSGIKHANLVRDLLRSLGESSESVSSKTPKDERKQILDGFRDGCFRHIASMALVTTGYDAPRTDGIVMLRATMSPGLYVQIAGRGLRLHPDKKNCLFVDYGTNVDRLGPLTHVTPPRSRRMGKNEGEGKEKKPLVRICEVCRTANDLEAVDCSECGTPLVKERKVSDKLMEHASESPIMMTDAEYLESRTSWVEVDGVCYLRHKKEGKPDSLRVSYRCGMVTHSEWICFEHGGFATKKAHGWWYRRMIDTPPATTDEALRLSNDLRTPSRIRVRKQEKHFEVIDYDFDTGPPRQAELAIGA